MNSGVIAVTCPVPPQRRHVPVISLVLRLPDSRRVQELERQLRRGSRGGEGAVPAAANEDSVSPSTRCSARSMASQRERLGLSAAECGLLIGASAQSVYNWEEGKARPRVQHLPAIFALRTLRRWQANEILESRKAA